MEKVVTTNGYSVFKVEGENIIKLIVVMFVQLCEYTKNH